MRKKISEKGKAFKKLVKNVFKPVATAIPVIVIIAIIGFIVWGAYNADWNFSKVNYVPIVAGWLGGGLIGGYVLLATAYFGLRYTVYKGNFIIEVEKSVNQFVLEPLTEFFDSRESKFREFCVKDEKVRVSNKLTEEKIHTASNTVKNSQETVAAQGKGDFNRLRLGFAQENPIGVEDANNSLIVQKDANSTIAAKEKSSGAASGASNTVVKNNDFDQKNEVKNTEKIEYELVEMNLELEDVRDKLIQVVFNKIKDRYSESALIKHYEGFLVLKDKYFNVKDEENDNPNFKNKNIMRFPKRNIQPVKVEGLVSVYSSDLEPIVRNKDKEQDEKTMDKALINLLSKYIVSLMKNLYTLNDVLGNKGNKNYKNENDQGRITPADWQTLQNVSRALLDIHDK
ncbi:hypothetical protein [Mycoplasmopsis gallinacea]|uniref:Uncharacterized protein n=1 Tax=Mycoplasmopsis gallinacea TaxID=29556 RepID=A0A449A2Z9_9BACT|nr:hypothetical protein [Mycoplasmopsis gallinacea]VEU58650.1 Uncharacterised protein [Mycoplasmopsis gallinacea]